MEEAALLFMILCFRIFILPNMGVVSLKSIANVTDAIFIVDNIFCMVQYFCQVCSPMLFSYFILPNATVIFLLGIK